MRSFVLMLALVGSLVAAVAGAEPAPSSPIDKAVSLRQAGQFEPAAQLLLTWLADHPTDARAHHELGALYALHGQLRESIEQFESALRAEPTATTSKLALAEVLRADERCKEALVYTRQLTDSDAGNGPAWKSQALCQATLGQWDAAIAAADALAQRFTGQALGTWGTERGKTYRDLKASGGLTVGQMDAEGKALFAEKRFADAAIWLGEAMRTEPSADRAYRLAMAQLGTQDLLACQTSLQAALKLDRLHQPSLMALPTIAKALRTLGKSGVDVSVARLNETPERAIARALVEGDLVLARQLLGAVLPPTAAAVALPAGATPVQLTPVQLPAAATKTTTPGAVLLLLAGEVALRDGQASKATEWLDKALKVAPKHDAARKAMADAYLQIGRLSDARRLAELPPPPAHITDNADLRIFAVKRRAEVLDQLRRMLDPGLMTHPSLQDQVARDLPKPPEPVVAPKEPEPPPPPPPPTKGKKGKQGKQGKQGKANKSSKPAKNKAKKAK